MSEADRMSYTSMSGVSKSVGGRTVSKTDKMNSIAHSKTYSKDGRVLNENNHEEKIKIAIRAQRARRDEVVGLSGKPNVQMARQRSMKVPRIEKNKESYELIKNALDKNILFNDCSQEQIETIIFAMKPKKIAKQTTLINEGDEGYNFYIIQAGRFEFFKNGEKVGEAQGGDSFGELALLYFAPRGVTVTSVTQAEVWKLDRITFRQILDSSNETKRSKIREGVKRSPLFADLSTTQVEQLTDIAHYQSFKTNDVIIRKGDVGNFFYIIAAGRVQVTKAGDLEELSDTIFSAGDYFGERAFLSNERRNANVIALEDTDCLVFDKEAFDKHLGSLVETLDRNLGMRVLQSVELLQELDHEMFTELCDELVPEAFKKGDIIIKEGDVGDKFYIIKEGQVQVVKQNEGSEDTIVTTIGTGGYFGEFALLSSEKRAASVVAITDVAVFSLIRETFERLFGPLDSLEKKAEIRKSELKKSHYIKRSGSSVSANSSIEPLKNSIQFTDLKVLSTLGTGTFGRVKLVQHIATGQTYALKILQKQKIVQYRQQNNVMTEKLVMHQSDHPFILKLYQTFKDKKSLYMLLELVQGGELFQLLHSSEDHKVSNSHARFYAACVVDAIQYLHGRQIVYRDLKPENLMIDTEGYVKVVDFGFAKKVTKKTYTLCGTPEYLAPELVLQKGHDRAVDYWAIGVLIFEMLASYSPFADQKRNEQITICRNIVRLRFDFPRKFPSNAKNLVQRLLKKHPRERIGMAKEGAQEIKDHKWFQEVRWDQLYEKRLSAPWIPAVQNNLDVSNFEPYEEEEENLEYVDDGTNWDEQF